MAACDEGGTLDEVFKALADPSRRLLLDKLNARSGQTLRELCDGLDMARQSVSKHLAALEAANLVTTTWRGREKLHYLNAEPINAIAERWIRRYDRARAQALADLKTALEQEIMSGTEFAYTTYIKTTPERLWQALTDPAFTSRYWGVTLETDWKAGSPMIWTYNGVKMADPEQVVLEADPPRRLAYTWHSFTPEFAKLVGLAGEQLDKLLSEQRSRVSFDLEPLGGVVKLTVIHSGDKSLLDTVGDGWSHLLSSLKTLLETGETLPGPD